VLIRLLLGLPLTVQEKNRRGKGDERKSGDGVKRHNKSGGDKIINKLDKVCSCRKAGRRVESI
jgi:hypothetical protein